jgi:hypothetical protein
MSIRNLSRQFVNRSEHLYFGDIDAYNINCKKININGVPVDIDLIMNSINNLNSKINVLENVINNHNQSIVDLQNDNIKLKEIIMKLVNIVL